MKPNLLTAAVIIAGLFGLSFSANADTDTKLPIAAKAFSKDDLEAGKKTYDQYCHICHAEGIAGAPKYGDVSAWKPHIDKGSKEDLERLYKHAVEGYQGKNGVMPPKGTCMTCSDKDLQHAVQFMISKVTKPADE